MSAPVNNLKPSKKFFCPVCKSDVDEFLPLPEYYAEQAKKNELFNEINLLK